MRYFLLIFSFVAFLAGQAKAQANLQYNLLNRAYYTHNGPLVKIYGEKSRALANKYGTDFLFYDSQYMQVYNYATYYRWFFRHFKTEFADYREYDRFFKQRDTKNMFAFIAKHYHKIEEIEQQKQVIMVDPVVGQ